MNYLSVCSGIEAATVAWHALGWNPVAFAEIEKFPSAVLTAHYVRVPNWGDMTKFKEWPDADIHVLVGGTPCQSFSVAGLRRGLADPRGNLMLTYLAILDRYRPTWMVWENVPGVLSSNKGRDFGSFLGALGELGYGWAYRSLDAQYFHLAQRRERVFVVGCVGRWERAAQVLFEPESLSGYPPPSREKGKEVAPTLSARTKGGGGLGTDFDLDGGLVGSYWDGGDIAETLDASNASKQQMMPEKRRFQAIVTHTLPGDGGSSRSYIAANWAVRRLTPVECARLQGFPDSYLDITYRGKPAADGPKYKALGNSMAVPVMRWIGERIKAVEGSSR